jgi:hypothetical protein
LRQALTTPSKACLRVTPARVLVKGRAATRRASRAPLTRARAGMEARHGRMAGPAIRPGSRSAAGLGWGLKRSTEGGSQGPCLLRF